MCDSKIISSLVAEILLYMRIYICIYSGVGDNCASVNVKNFFGFVIGCGSSKCHRRRSARYIMYAQARGQLWCV